MRINVVFFSILVSDIPSSLLHYTIFCYILFYILAAVGSKNPTKIRPVRSIFKKHFKNVQILGVSVPSEVKEQPTSDDEMYQGALTRATNALAAIKNADYGVGIEGGIHNYSYG